ncbi:hypothetical protein [Shewanella benthica]|uniref:hypothetical protein n=1 Tax=Shewanella benthica TaxID=43661 RepID=UPI000DD41F1A|nr:hypothetical protein [Shewanella benthica]
MVKINSCDDRLGKLESLLDPKPILPIHIYYRQHNQTRQQAIQAYAGGNEALYKKLLHDEGESTCFDVMPAVKAVKVTRGGKYANR